MQIQRVYTQRREPKRKRFIYLSRLVKYEKSKLSKSNKML